MKQFEKLFRDAYFKVPRGWFSKRKRQRKKARKQYGGAETLRQMIEHPNPFMKRIKPAPEGWGATALGDMIERSQVVGDS